ncbi:dynein light chain Tctex-type 5-B-like isoform X1 [Mytilus californianus]|uniref:dynein light chain Tctex-type 5-B-like isoform X1 n=1 Tax=Mytilus californianus TaxID=6549 RepID=UPI002245B448|nr:dynein light chain Tctex-type 5-B-like isoform X1 [Mytilus californianus]XP_052088608.1 dynein light chain Tctex-type 5-B-like isoform X1 [Mytilus californianus]
MTDAQSKAARLLRKQGSVSSLSSSDVYKVHKVGPYPELLLSRRNSEQKEDEGRSMSTVSFMDDPGHDDHYRPAMKYENSYQMTPGRKFPSGKVKNIIKDVLEGYLAEEKYEPELCKQMSKTISEVIKARVKELMIPRFKIICIVDIGQSNNQALLMGSRCLWDSANDTYSSAEFRNNSLFAIAQVYGVYYE